MTLQERTAFVITNVDYIAREHDRYEYGLPVYDAARFNEMTEIVAVAIREAVAEEREACARIANSWCDTKAGQSIVEDILARGEVKPQ